MKPLVRRAVVLAAAVAVSIAVIPAAPALAVGDISGTVWDWETGGTGVAGVTVTALDPTTGDPVGTPAITASDGTYTISGLADGDYVVRSAKSGYLTTYYGGDLFTFVDAVNSGGGLAATGSSGIDVFLPTDGVSGTVLDWATGSGGIGGVAVIALNASTGAAVGTTATTASDGTFTITGLSANVDYVLRASGPGFLTTFYGGDLFTLEDAVTGGGTLTLPADGSSFDIYLPTDGISGTVFDQANGSLPLGGVAVTAYVSTAGPESRGQATTTADDGTYTLSGLQPNVEYVLKFSKPGYLGTYYSSQVSFDDAVAGSHTVSLPQDGSTFDEYLALAPEQTITFGPLPDRTLADGSFELAASASSGLTVTYASLTPSICAVQRGGGTVLLDAVGTCTIRASQAGNDAWAPAADVDRSLTVRAAPARQEEPRPAEDAPVALPAEPAAGTEPLVLQGRAVMLPPNGIVTRALTLVSGDAQVAIAAGTVVTGGSGSAPIVVHAPVARTDIGVAAVTIATSAGDEVTFSPPISVTLAAPVAEASVRGATPSAPSYVPVRVGSDGSFACLSGDASSGLVRFSVDRPGTYALRGPERPAVVRAPVGPSPAIPGPHSRWVGQSVRAVVCPGQLVDVTVLLRNAGIAAWVKGTPSQVVLGSSAPRDNTREFDNGVLYAPLYNRDRFGTHSESRVEPGETGTFSFRLRGPQVAGPYRVDVRPVVEGVAWLEDEGIHLELTVR